MGYRLIFFRAALSLLFHKLEHLEEEKHQNQAMWGIFDLC